MDGQELMRFMLWDDPVFEPIMVHPAALGLIQYLLGTNCILSLCDGWLKGKGEARTGVHCDWAQFEMPTFPPEPYTANFNYLLSDYSKDDGALGFVPGSHRWRRWPSPEEAEYWNDRMQPVEAPMGSMIIWGDHTWHGSYPRKTQGLRLMMLGTYCRSHMQTQEPFRQTVTQEALDRNPVRFGRLMDVAGGFPSASRRRDRRNLRTRRRDRPSRRPATSACSTKSPRPARSSGVRKSTSMPTTRNSLNWLPSKARRSSFRTCTARRRRRPTRYSRRVSRQGCWAESRYAPSSPLANRPSWRVCPRFEQSRFAQTVEPCLRTPEPNNRRPAPPKNEMSLLDDHFLRRVDECHTIVILDDLERIRRAKRVGCTNGEATAPRLADHRLPPALRQ